MVKKFARQKMVLGIPGIVLILIIITVFLPLKLSFTPPYIETQKAYAGTVTDFFTDEGKIASRENVAVSAGTVVMSYASVYAIAYKGPSSVGYLKTVEILFSGEPITSAGGSLDFETKGKTPKTPNIIPVSGNVYAIAYEGPSGSSGGGSQRIFWL